MDGSRPAQSSFGFRQQAIKEKVHRVLPRNALHSLTARRHQRSTTRECSCADQSSHYKRSVCFSSIFRQIPVVLHLPIINITILAPDKRSSMFRQIPVVLHLPIINITILAPDKRSSMFRQIPVVLHLPIINITILAPDKRSYFNWNTPFYLLLEQNNSCN